MLERIYATIIFIITLLFFTITYQYMPMRENFENRFVYQPRRCDRYEHTPAEHGMHYKQFWINQDEKDICAWLISKNEGQISNRLVIYCHGNGGNMENTLPFANALITHADTDLLLFDYSGYGLSPGETRERDMVGSLISCINFALDHWRARQIVIYGFSLGAAVAIAAAARLKHLKFAGIVLEAPFYSLERRALDSTWWANWWNFANKYENFIKIQIPSSPILLVHSPTDDIIAVDHSEKLHAIMDGKPNYQGLLYIEGTHNNPIYTPDYWMRFNRLLQPLQPAE